MRFVHLMKVVEHVLVVGCVVMMGMTLSASEVQRDGRGKSPERLPLRELDLSNLQRQQIQELREQNGEAVRRAHENVEKARRELHDAIASAVVNEGAIRALAVDLGVHEGNAAVFILRPGIC